MHVGLLIENRPYQQEINANYPSGILEKVTSYKYFDACAQSKIFKPSAEQPVQCGIASFPPRIVFLPAWELLPFACFFLVSKAL